MSGFQYFGLKEYPDYKYHDENWKIIGEAKK